MLLDAFNQEGCPICGLVDRNVLRYLDMLIHEGVNDIDFRDELRQVGGFCNHHAWLLVTGMRGAAVGAAIMYRDLLNTYRHAVHQAAGSQKAPGPLWRRRASAALSGRGATPERNAGCPVCQIARRDEAIFAGAFAEHCDEWKFVEAYDVSYGLCRPHFEQVLDQCGRSAASALLDAQTKVLSRIVDELDRFLEKSDYRAVEQPTPREARSWQRAIELATGKNGFF
jgi:hypothetical protein